MCDCERQIKKRLHRQIFAFTTICLLPVTQDHCKSNQIRFKDLPGPILDISGPEKKTISTFFSS